MFTLAEKNAIATFDLNPGYTYTVRPYKHRNSETTVRLFKHFRCESAASKDGVPKLAKIVSLPIVFYRFSLGNLYYKHERGNSLSRHTSLMH